MQWIRAITMERGVVGLRPSTLPCCRWRQQFIFVPFHNLLSWRPRMFGSFCSWHRGTWFLIACWMVQVFYMPPLHFLLVLFSPSSTMPPSRQPKAYIPLSSSLHRTSRLFTKYVHVMIDWVLLSRSTLAEQTMLRSLAPALRTLADMIDNMLDFDEKLPVRRNILFSCCFY